MKGRPDPAIRGDTPARRGHAATQVPDQTRWISSIHPPRFLLFKRAFPRNYSSYRVACAAGEVRLGEMFVPATDRTPLIINFPTKDHWRSASQLSYIEAGLRDLRRVLHEWDLDSVALPALGCGLGGLPWAHVRREIESTLGSARSSVLVFEPSDP